MLRAIALALVEAAQAAAAGTTIGLDRIRRELAHRERQDQEARRLERAVHRDLERL